MTALVVNNFHGKSGLYIFSQDPAIPEASGTYKVCKRGTLMDINGNVSRVAITYFKHSNLDHTNETKVIAEFAKSDVRSLHIAQGIGYSDHFIIFDEYACNLKQLQVSHPEYLRANFFALVKSVLNGLVFLHTRDLAHRDIKLANILVEVINPSHRLSALIADFADTMNCHSSKALRIVGTSDYLAPEAMLELSKGHSDLKKGTDLRALDVWAAGFMFFKLNSTLSSFNPPHYHLGSVSKDSARKFEYTYKKMRAYFNKPDCFKFLRMLRFDPSTRATAAQALELFQLNTSNS